MKLKTMLLPTGEFVLVVSEKPNATPEELEAWQNIRDSVGAACVIWSAEEIEVEDALYDGGARRRDELPGVWQDLGYLTEDDEEITEEQADEAGDWVADWVNSDRDGDAQLLKAYNSGAEFSPAGLVKDGPKSTVTEEELVGRTATEGLPDPFTPGTRVEIIGDSLWHHQEKWPGTHGVVGNPHTRTSRPEGSIYVESEVEDESGYINRWFFPPSSLQPVPAILEYDEGDDD
jgi:hypothetical protein